MLKKFDRPTDQTAAPTPDRPQPDAPPSTPRPTPRARRPRRPPPNAKNAQRAEASATRQGTAHRGRPAGTRREPSPGSNQASYCQALGKPLERQRRRTGACTPKAGSATTAGIAARTAASLLASAAQGGGPPDCWLPGTPPNGPESRQRAAALSRTRANIAARRTSAGRTSAGPRTTGTREDGGAMTCIRDADSATEGRAGGAAASVPVGRERAARSCAGRRCSRKPAARRGSATAPAASSARASQRGSGHGAPRYAPVRGCQPPRSAANCCGRPPPVQWLGTPGHSLVRPLDTSVA